MEVGTIGKNGITYPLVREKEGSRSGKMMRTPAAIGFNRLIYRKEV